MGAKDILSSIEERVKKGRVRVSEVEKEYQWVVKAVEAVTKLPHMKKFSLGCKKDGTSWIVYQGTPSEVCARVRRGYPISVYRPFLLHELRTNSLTKDLFKLRGDGMVGG